MVRLGHHKATLGVLRATGVVIFLVTLLHLDATEKGDHQMAGMVIFLVTLLHLGATEKGDRQMTATVTVHHEMVLRHGMVIEEARGGLISEVRQVKAVAIEIFRHKDTIAGLPAMIEVVVMVVLIATKEETAARETVIGAEMMDPFCDTVLLELCAF